MGMYLENGDSADVSQRRAVREQEPLGASAEVPWQIEVVCSDL
jgi:hypothetical protein